MLSAEPEEEEGEEEVEDDQDEELGVQRLQPVYGHDFSKPSVVSR